MTLDFDRFNIPEYVRPGLERYLNTGQPTGSFLHAVLTNNLYEAATRADPDNLGRLRDFALFLRWEFPPEAYGSPEKVKAWRGRGEAGS